MTQINIKKLFSCFQKLVVVLLLVGMAEKIPAQQLLRVVVVGLNHDHVHGVLNQFNKGQVKIVGIVEPDKQLQQKFSKLYQLPDSLFFSDLKKVVIDKNPDAVLGYNEVAKHVDIVEICAPLGIAVMVEKPLAATLAQAQRMELLANKFHTKVLTNFETTWYASYLDVYNSIRQEQIGSIKKITRTDDIGWSAAFALGSLRIMYGDAKQVTISPKNKQQFLEDLIASRPELVIVG